MDASGSIKSQGEENWSLVLNFISSIVSKFSIGPSETRVGLVSFSNTAELNVRLDQYYDKRALINYIDQGNFYADGETNTYVSIKSEA